MEKSRRSTLKPILLLLFLTFAWDFYWNENTRHGDRYRHRPLWMAPFYSFLPDFDLKASWFLHGDEDSTTREGLRVAIQSLNTEAGLNPIGKIIAGLFLKEQLNQRTCMMTTLQKRADNGEIQNLTGVQPPIIVLGVSGPIFFLGM